jgi:hypothetical protein
MINTPYQANRKFSDQQHALIVKVIKKHIGKMAEVTIANDLLDMHHCTDYVATIPYGHIACRIRSFSGLRYHQVTIRSKGYINTKVELDKLMEGGENCARWYLYSWLNPQKTDFAEYLIFDVGRFRQSGLIVMPEDIHKNDDGSEFFAWDVETLEEAGCVIVHDKTNNPLK